MYISSLPQSLELLFPASLPRYVKTTFSSFCLLLCSALLVSLELPSCRVKFPLPLDPGPEMSRKVYFNYTISFPIFVTHGTNQIWWCKGFFIM